MSTATIAAAPPKPNWSFWQVMIAWGFGAFLFCAVMGAITDSYCQAVYAKRPIKRAVAHVIWEVGDAIGFAKYFLWLIPFADPPPVEYRAIQADETGVITEQDHNFYDG